MSSWVHVAAIARIDYLPILKDGTETDFDTIFGKECLWGDGNFKYAFNTCNSNLHIFYLAEKRKSL